MVRTIRDFAYEFLCFGIKQAWACLFGGCMVALLLVSALYWPREASFARYDALTLAALAKHEAQLVFVLPRNLSGLQLHAIERGAEQSGGTPGLAIGEHYQRGRLDHLVYRRDLYGPQ